jgi:hypothetical protein
MLIEVDVQTGIYGHFSFMLHIRQEVGQMMHPVVVD